MHDDDDGEEAKKILLAVFFPVKSTNVRISRQIFLTFICNSFATLL